MVDSLRVPEPETVKNRMHLFLRPVDRSRDEEVERLLGLGARLVNDLRTGDTGWAVLADPDGIELIGQSLVRVQSREPPDQGNERGDALRRLAPEARGRRE